ncbi:MAG: 2-amino-3,7-dideoxy-D-threo-hept-6-ulosonate synthase [Candidatus Thalassarchaeaceae archaeon]|nr:2-amino-3,7-dideoxy-D-threo-hept-6-ulosonate synthase [Candidatus Thalassarchaeaceae archaeon]
MMKGLETRLEQILPGGKGVWIPIDHGISNYPEVGLENINSTIKILIDSGVDAIVLHKGVLSHQKKLTEWDGFVCHVSASTVHGGSRSGEKVSIATAEECLDRGAIAVSGQINIGDPSEPDMLLEMGDLTTDAWALGMPVLGMMYPRGVNMKIGPDDSTNGVAHAARLAWEIGCNVVKVPWTGSIDSFRNVTNSVPIPVLIAGGINESSFGELLKIVEKSIQAGGSGVCIGRQVFGSENPELCIKALKAIVHEGISAKDATKFLE